jgi:hypothetical protein
MRNTYADVLNPFAIFMAVKSAGSNGQWAAQLRLLGPSKYFLSTFCLFDHQSLSTSTSRQLTGVVGGGGNPGVWFLPCNIAS